MKDYGNLSGVRKALAPEQTIKVVFGKSHPRSTADINESIKHLPIKRMQQTLVSSSSEAPKSLSGFWRKPRKFFIHTFSSLSAQAFDSADC